MSEPDPGKSDTGPCKTSKAPQGAFVVSESPPTPVIHRLTRRADFLLAAGAASQPRGAVVVQMRARGDDSAVIRVGFTASKRVGGAVLRNRAKRRLREAVRALVPVHGVPGSDYVFIARPGTPARPWERLLDDVKSALIRLAAKSSSAASAPEPDTHS
ncbi:MAG: ribonuclease P protein component [Brevundimonas sp.]|jgi:ribonuclease P protein component|uniref:ribonuclease P protein component n=1 Tax=Brevundimonas sp. TaxID=1871086 RepID=UPI00391C8A26